MIGKKKYLMKILNFILNTKKDNIGNNSFEAINIKKNRTGNT